MDEIKITRELEAQLASVQRHIYAIRGWDTVSVEDVKIIQDKIDALRQSLMKAVDAAV